MKSIIRLPGLIDVHVHLREPGGTQKEDFSTGTQAAIAGGYTQILDMPNNIPATIDQKSLTNKFNLARDKIWCDVGFNFGATAKSTRHFSKISASVFGLKVYMNQTTGNLLVEDPKERELIFKSWKNRLPIMVHAKDETIEIAIYLARKFKKKIHICHVTYSQLDPIKKAKLTGVNISSEICPHHLFLNDGNVKKLGSFGMMQPPLMTKVDQEKIWGRLSEIDMISTDHAPHTKKEKLDKKSPKFGIPGLETTLPLFFHAINEKKISLKQFITMTHDNPKKIFSLPSQKNTYIEVNTSPVYKISSKNLYTKCKWTPFENLPARGKVNKVVIRNHVVFEKGIFAKKPTGKIIAPYV